MASGQLQHRGCHKQARSAATTADGLALVAASRDRTARCWPTNREECPK